MRVNKCDICGKTDHETTLFSVKCKSPIYVDKFAVLFDLPFSDVRKFHICEDCVKQFKEFVKCKNEQTQETTQHYTIKIHRSQFKNRCRK